MSATYSFTIAVANREHWNLLRATVEAVSEEVSDLMGHRMTRLRSAHAAGATTLEVESTYGYPASGVLLVAGEPNPIAYSGIDQTPTAQEFTGCDPLTIDHVEEDEVIDWTRSETVLDALRRAQLVDYADGRDLDRIGRSNVVARPRPMVSDDGYRGLIKVMAWLPRSTIFALESVLDVLFPLGGYEIYESLVEHPGVVFITLPGEIGTTELGRAFLSRAEAATSTDATTVAVSDDPSTVCSVTTQPVDIGLDMADLPSAAAIPWDYVAESAGLEGAYFAIVSDQLEHDHPAGTDSGRYEREIAEIGTWSRLRVAWKIDASTTIAGKPWKLILEDGEIECAMAWDDAEITLCQSDNTAVSAVAALFTAGAVWHAFELAREGDWIVGRHDGAEVLREPVSAFAPSANTRASFGYVDNGDANEWTVVWDDVWFYSKNARNFWNLDGDGGALALGSTSLTDAGNPFAASDAGKVVFLDAANDENYGTWRVDAYVGADEVELAGIERTDGYCDTLIPTSFYAERDRFTARDVGKSIGISAGDNIGSHAITAFVSAREVTCAGSTFTTETGVAWAFEPTFVNEAAVPWEIAGAGTVAADVLTLRQNLPAAVQPVTVRYTVVDSAQILAGETVENTGGTTYYPFYISGPPEWIESLIDDVTAAGVIAKFSRPW